MLKNILMSGLFCASVYAESFDIFLQKAIDNSPYLKSHTLGIEQAIEKGSAITRYANPSLALEYSEFDPNVGNKDNGYRVNYSQPIRLWSVGDDKEALSNTILRNSNASYAQTRAAFIRDISLSFTSYAQQKSLLKLGGEELKIAKNIYEISKARYESGTISRGMMLQAKVAYEMVQISNESLVLRLNQSYFDLLKLAGLNELINLDTEFDFEISPNTASNNPQLARLKAEQETALDEAKVHSHSVEWINIFAEYESEPEQDIVRAGINFPLALFNTKSQERQIATLQASRDELILNNETSRLDIDNTRLKKERDSLETLRSKNEKMLSTELELLRMFEEGYKIANINLLELQDIKNKVIETKESLIQIKTALDRNAIHTNYNQGTYNE